MALTPDFANRIIDSSASILDIVQFHQALRAIEASEAGMVHPVIHTFKAVPIGGDAYFYAVEFVNTWRLRFPAAGDYQVVGNITVPIIGVAGVFVQQTKALAFATSSAGGGSGGGLTAEQDALLTALAKINGLVRGTPAVLTPTSRVAGDIIQSFVENGGTVTVTRE